MIPKMVVQHLIMKGRRDIFIVRLTRNADIIKLAMDSMYFSHTGLRLHGIVASDYHSFITDIGYQILTERSIT